MSKYYTPTDLADYVHRQLNLSKMTVKPSLKVLTELFTTMYYTSLKTEESQFIKVTVTLVNHDTIKEFDEDSDELDKWRYYPFNERQEFNVKNMVKLSKAADPWSSSLAVYSDSNEKLYINGMIDQAIHYQSFLNYERDEKPDHPGIIQTMINGIGILNVMLDYQSLATLNQNSLIKLYPNVFKLGPVFDFLKRFSAIPDDRLETLLDIDLDEDSRDDINEVIYDFTVQAICRILLKMKNYHHGGAILITRNTKENLTVKYGLKYNRIPTAIEHLVSAIGTEEHYEEKIEKLLEKKMSIPAEDFEEYNENKADIDSCYDEMIGAVRFTASLSCVDGLVLMSPRLDVHGFGTVIAKTTPPKYIYISNASRISSNTIELQSNHYGTRHQSMFAYCLQHPESVGFVISQDGEIRAIKSVEGKVYMWENIRVYQFERSNKLPKVLSAR